MREYVFGDYRIDMASYQLWRGNHLITLTPKAFDILAVLIQHRDRTVGKDELLSSVWPGSSVTEDSLKQCISVLRRALGDDTTHPTLIATIARRGYRFVALVIEVPLDPPGDAESTAGPGFPPSTSTSPMKSLALTEGKSNFRVLTQPLLVNRGFRNWKHWLALLGGVAALAIGTSLPRFFSSRREARQEISPLRFLVSAPKETSLISGGILSPNGRYMLLLAEDDRSGIVQIWIRPLDTLQSRPIPGTESASRPFWSPDSRHIGFFARGKLKRAGIDNQVAQVITSAGTSSSGATWSSKGVILFAEVRSGLYSVPESGGAPTAAVTTLNSKEQEVAHRWPQFLPDGNHFLYYVVSAKPNQAGTYLGSLHSKQVEHLLDVPAIFAQPGYLVYTRDHLLMAQTFDLAPTHARQNPMVISGTAFPAGSFNQNTLSAANLSISANGLLAYASSDGMPQLKWFNRSGHELDAIDTPAPVLYPALSPDGKQLLVGGRDVDHGIWLVDVSRGVSTRIIWDGMSPLWSPDGAQIAFSADRAGANSLFTRPATRYTADTLVLRTGHNKILNDWSPDGRYILYTDLSPEAKNELWILPMFGDHKPRPFLQTPFDEAQGQISPDGHWVAYASDESGAWEVYLDSFPESSGKRILSIDGGVEPHWRKDGKELFYLSPDRNLMAVSITLGSSPKIERPKALFRAPLLPVPNILSNQLAVSADGQRFLIGSVGRTNGYEQITVLSSWPSLLVH